MMKFRRTASQPDAILLDPYPNDVLAIDTCQPIPTSLERSATKEFSFSSLWKWMLNFFSGSSEPIVKGWCDRNGTSYFAVYDPMSCTWTSKLTEAEVREWIEQRYYQ